MLEETKSNLWFYDDINLLAGFNFNWKYKDFSTLSTKLTIEILSQLQNVTEIQKALTIVMEDIARVAMN